MVSVKKVLLGIVLLLALAIGVLGFIAPKNYTVERETVVNQPKVVVFQKLKFLKNHSSWSPWEKRDPMMKKEYKGEDGTVGFIVAWAGNKEVGVGEQEIKNIVDGERIDTELRFKEPFADTANAYLVTEAVSDGRTKVRWGMNGRSPFPLNIVCMLMKMQEMIAADFDEGLAQLKTELEK